MRMKLLIIVDRFKSKATAVGENMKSHLGVVQPNESEANQPPTKKYKGLGAVLKRIFSGVRIAPALQQ